MITVTFLNGCILATAEQSLWQYSYNQQLQIVGLELPEVFTVDFCNDGDTTTVAMIGSSDVVDIPNELLTSGRGIVAYVFQKSALTGGVTRCEIRIDVLTRPERDDETPTPEQEAVIDQYIAELNEGVEKANESAEDAEAWAVGERGGEPVSESDPTYENNAKYWAENISGQLEDYRTAADQDAIDSAQDGKINALTNLLNKKQSKITANGILKGDGNGGISAAVPGMDYLPTSALYAYRSAIKQDEIDNEQNANIAKNADDIADVKTTADAALQPAALAPYRTAADQDTIDNAQAADIAAINDKIPSTASKNNKLVAWSTFNGQLGTKQAKITANGILKGDGAGGVSAAVAGTDYLAPSALAAYRTAAAQDEIDAAQDADIDDLKSATSDIEATLAARYYTLTIGRYNPTTKQKSGTQTDRIFSSLIPFYNLSINYTVPTGYKCVYYLYDANETLTVSYDSSWATKISVSNPGGYIAIVWANTSFGNLTETDVAALSDTFGTRLDTMDSTIAFNRNKADKLFVDAGTVEIGSISMSTGEDEDATNRARTNMVWFRSGTKISIPTGYQATVLRYLPTGVYRATEAYWQSGEYIVPSDGYRRLLIREPSNTALTGAIATLNNELFAYVDNTDEVPALSAAIGIAHEPLVLRIGNITPATGEIATARSDRISTGFVKIPFFPCKIAWGENFRGYVYEYDANKVLIASSASPTRSGKITNSTTAFVIVVFYKTTFDAFNAADTESLFASFHVQNKIEAARATAPALSADYNLPILTIVDDDGRTDLPTFLDMMAGKGVSMTAALITDRVGTNASLPLAQILSYKAQGFDFISHSATHSKDIFGSSVGTGNYTNFSLVSDSDIIGELKSSHDFLIKYGLNAECIAWPWGHYPEAFQSAMNNPDPNDADVCGAENQKLRYAKIAKEVGYIYGLDSLGGMNSIGAFDNYWISREAFYSDDTNYPESYYTGLLDKCKQSGGWLILMTHCSDPVYGDVTKLGNVVQYALDHGISVLNMKEAYAKKKNAVSAGLYADPNSYFVGNDGFSR